MAVGQVQDFVLFDEERPAGFHGQDIAMAFNHGQDGLLAHGRHVETRVLVGLGHFDDDGFFPSQAPPRRMQASVPSMASTA